ncbi:hypothetical protein GGI35DRAFT_489916, partial [Trichoderma velutinum]
IFLPTCAIILPILIPLNYIDGNGRSISCDEVTAAKLRPRIAGLDTLAWGNIKRGNTGRYTAHLILAIITIVWTCAVFIYEFKWYVEVRQHYFTKINRNSMNMILVSSIPPRLLGKEAELKKIFSAFPGGVRKIWFNRDLSKLLQKIAYRKKVHRALEEALTKYIWNVDKAYMQWRKYSGAQLGLQSTVNDTTIPCSWSKHRPEIWVHRSKIQWLYGIPFLWEKTDAIEWYSKELNRLDESIEKERTNLFNNEQEHLNHYPLLNSAYIQFNRQIAAHMACQSVMHHSPGYLATRLCEISLEGIFWDNVAISWWQEQVRVVAVVVVLTGMVVLWAIPVAWSGALSQLSNLIQSQSWLSFLRSNTFTEYTAKALSGILPAVMIEILLFIVPFILRALARVKGVKTSSQETEFIQKTYFIFLYIQVFLVISIASFFTVTLGEYWNNLKELQTIQDVLNLLAQNLPKAANYFFCYMILQAMAASSATLLQLGRLVSWFIVGRLFDNTPRKRWARRYEGDNIDWATFFPVYTNFACIGLIYCVIAPLILVCTIITFLLLWLAHGYSITRVSRFETDTGGILYPRAINQTFTGLYVMELCMAGMFFGVIDDSGRHTCTVHGFFMVASLILTATYQILLNSFFSPLFNYLPIELATERRVEEETDGAEHSRATERLLTPKWEKRHGSGRTENPNGSSSMDDAFQHPALRTSQPVWIPKIGIEAFDNELLRTVGGRVEISNEGARIKGGYMEVYGGPPSAGAAL